MYPESGVLAMFICIFMQVSFSIKALDINLLYLWWNFTYLLVSVYYLYQ